MQPLVPLVFHNLPSLHLEEMIFYTCYLEGDMNSNLEHKYLSTIVLHTRHAYSSSVDQAVFQV